MAHGYSKQQVIRNIRKTRSLNELHELAYAPKGQMYGYAKNEAKKEIRRRLTHKKRRVVRRTNQFGFPKTPFGMKF